MTGKEKQFPISGIYTVATPVNIIRIVSIEDKDFVSWCLQARYL